MRLQIQVPKSCKAEVMELLNKLEAEVETRDFTTSQVKMGMPAAAATSSLYCRFLCIAHRKRDAQQTSKYLLVGAPAQHSAAQHGTAQHGTPHHGTAQHGAAVRHKQFALSKGTYLYMHKGTLHFGDANDHLSL